MNKAKRDFIEIDFRATARERARLAAAARMPPQMTALDWAKIGAAILLAPVLAVITWAVAVVLMA